MVMWTRMLVVLVVTLTATLMMIRGRTPDLSHPLEVYLPKTLNPKSGRTHQADSPSSVSALFRRSRGATWEVAKKRASEDGARHRERERERKREREREGERERERE